MPLKAPIIWLIGIVFVCSHFYRINDGPNGFHTWREADTASVAANFFVETKNILEPRIDVRGEGNGLIGMEFPIYSYIVGFLFDQFGHHHAWARALTTLAGMLCLWEFFFIHRKLYPGREHWQIFALIAFVVSPLFFFYSRKIQPDVLGLYLLLKGFRAFIENPQRIALSGCCIALAGMIKPTFLFIGLPMLFVLQKEKGWSFLRESKYYALFLIVVCPVAIWIGRARGINASINSDYFYLGGNWSDILLALQGYQFYQNVFLT